MNPGGDILTTTAQFCVPLSVARTAREAAPFWGPLRTLEGAAFAAPRPARGLFCDAVVLITGLWFKAYEFINGDWEVEFDVEDLS